MSFNKDEALRARDMAENMMKKADFISARRVALRAYKLDSSLDKISHMVMVCDVHCSASEKVFGNEMNWYGILQVDQKADDVTIKKQYKKLALILHPDKNKLPGAESAFKLIGEAQRILLDKEKRSIHDSKRRPVNRAAPRPAYHTQPVFTANNNVMRTYIGPRPVNQHQPASSSTLPTFWTSCPFCATTYQYSRVHINKNIICRSCNKQFTSFEVPRPVVPPLKRNVPAFNEGQKQPDNNAKQGFPMSGSAAKHTGPATSSFPKHNFPNPFSAAQKHPESSASKHPGKGVSAPGCGVTAKDIGGKRKRKKTVESSESSDSQSRSESEEDGDVKAGQGSVSAGGHQPRRSVRSKRQVSYKENIDNDDDSYLNTKPKGSSKTGDGDKVEEHDHSNGTLPYSTEKNKKLKEKGKEKVGASAGKSKRGVRNSEKDSASKGVSEPRFYDCADPDFNDFDKLREARKFAAGQTWAIYDNHDGMPRFYAYIDKRLAGGFKLKITWLEADPDDPNESTWFKANLPVSVGKFSVGQTQYTSDRLMFSHLIHFEGMDTEAPYWVFPRIGETWALFKNWDFNWSSDPDSHREFEYEFVEIVSEYSEGSGISVVFLYQLKGFSSVFSRIPKGGTDKFQILPCELYRFSHRVPSFKLNGMKEKGLPEGSLELDPASLPENMEEVSVSVPVPVPPNLSATPVKSKVTSATKENRSSASISNSILILESEFHNFDVDKSKEHFKKGQIWALYSKEDGLPKNYAEIVEVIKRPVFKLRIRRLELESIPEKVIRWRDEKMPISCGQFTVKDKSVKHAIVSDFSHEVSISDKSSTERDLYTIVPKATEVWAMYKNWNDGMKVADLTNWEYEIVEILGADESEIEVFLLERVDGYDTVFKQSVDQGPEVRKQIPMAELLRFSHRVPVFWLTGEREGSLRNSVEIDPSSMPPSFFSS